MDITCGQPRGEGRYFVYFFFYVVRLKNLSMVVWFLDWLVVVFLCRLVVCLALFAFDCRVLVLFVVVGALVRCMLFGVVVWLFLLDRLWGRVCRFVRVRWFAEFDLRVASGGWFLVALERRKYSVMAFTPLLDSSFAFFTLAWIAPLWICSHLSI